MQIVDAVSPPQLAQVRGLFEEYWQSFGFTPCFQGFAQELDALPADYVRIRLALVDGHPAGCVAMRVLDPNRAEFKRLYVRPAFRGTGLGGKLLAEVMVAAREMGCRQLVCDTMPAMSDALAMYRRAGFQIAEPYSDNPTPGAIYLRLELAS